MKRLLLPSSVLLFAASLAAQTATHRSYDTAFLGPPIADPVLQHAKETFVLFGCAYCHGLNLVSRGEATDLMHSALVGSDENGNTIVGTHLGLSTEGTIVRADDGHLVVTLGIKDCIIVHTRNATLVADKHSEDQIRQVVKKLEELGWSDYL